MNRPVLSKRLLALLPYMGCLGAVTLCSCTGAPPYDAAGKFWLRRPPSVPALVPPQADSGVQIRLAPGFRHDCNRSAVRPPAASAPPTPVTDEYVRRLALEQDRLLQLLRSLRASTREAMGLAALECARGMSALREDRREKWQNAQEVAFRQILGSVLTHKQRTYYERLRRKHKPPEEIFPWLALTGGQKLQMVRTYERHLQECQPAWALSESFRIATHANLDRLLSDCAEAISQSRATCVAYDALRNAVDAVDREFREAQRQLTWLESQLEAEKDTKQQLRLRKEIIDKRVDAEESKANAIRHKRLLQAYVWRFKDVAKAASDLESQLLVLRELHDVYCECTSLVSSLEGRVSSGCIGVYASLDDALRRAIQLVKEHSGHFPPSCIHSITKVAAQWQ